MKEKLQQFALIAEIISAIAIVLSLIFVGLQVRLGAQETAANSVALSSSVQQAMMDADKDLLLFHIGRPELETQYESTALGTPGDYFYFFSAVLRTRQLYWMQHEAGLMDDETYYSYLGPFVLGTLGNNPGARAYWAEQRFMPEGLVSDVETLWAEYFPDRDLYAADVTE